MGATGERLREHAKARTITVERIDRETGDRRTEQRELRPVAGFDLVFGAPKSVSLLHAFGDHDTRLAVSQAHESAWQVALADLEDEACVTRRGKGGIVREHAGGFVAAAYQHRTSRAHDPHLHTHVIVANLAQSPDGTWRALEGDALLRGYRLAAGYLGVRNGTRATILDVDERAQGITIQTDRDDTLTLPRRYLDDGHVQLGFANGGPLVAEPDRRAGLRPGPPTTASNVSGATWPSHAAAAPPASTSPKPPSRSKTTPPAGTAGQPEPPGPGAGSSRGTPTRPRDRRRLRGRA